MERYEIFLGLRITLNVRYSEHVLRLAATILIVTGVNVNTLQFKLREFPWKVIRNRLLLDLNIIVNFYRFNVDLISFTHVGLLVKLQVNFSDLVLDRVVLSKLLMRIRLVQLLIYHYLWLLFEF